MKKSNIKLQSVPQSGSIGNASFPMISPHDSDAKIHIGEYLDVIKRYKWSILVLALLGAVVGGLKAVSEVPVYRATTTMVVEPDFSSLASAKKGAVVYATAWRFYETQYDLLRSRAVAARVVDKLGLVERGTPKPRPAISFVSELKKMFGMESTSDSKSAHATTTLGPEQLKRVRSGIAAMIQGSVNVRGGEKSQLVYVSFDSTDAKFAADVANALVDAYIDLELESRLDRAKLASSWLTERLTELREKLTQSEQQLQTFQSREGMVDLKSIEELTSKELGLLNQELVAAEAKYSELAKRYGPKHPRMIAALAELNATKRRLEDASKRVVNARGKEFQLDKLERDVGASRELYGVFLSKFREADLSVDKQLSSARTVDKALPPRAPFKPDKTKILTMWALIGLSFGVFLAFLREHLDNTFSSTEKVEQKLNLPVLGVMPLLNIKDLRTKKETAASSVSETMAPERYFIHEKKSSFSEAVNHIRTGIMYSNVDNPPKSILITSSLQAEGKTTLATNLAMSMAQLGKTLLIDADFRKPKFAAGLSNSSGNGLVDYVAGTGSLNDCIVADDECPDLYVLESGVVPPNPLELLSSKRLARTLGELNDNFAHVVIDTAPILPVSDAIVLGHLVDAVLMVIQSGRTTQHIVRDAMRRLDGANITPLGIVLTQVSFQKNSYYYGGKYHYYYGSTTAARKAS